MNIDASAAILRLGIKATVRFVPRDLRFLAESAVTHQGCTPPTPGAKYFCSACVHPFTPGVVYVDEDQLRTCASMGDDPAQTIAEELVHLAQFERIGTGPEAIELFLREKAKGYDRNAFEVQAHALAPVLAPLVKVEL